jgi:hypothetical protein
MHRTQALRRASTGMHAEPCGHPSSGLGCSSKGGFDPFALQLRPRTLGAGGLQPRRRHGSGAMDGHGAISPLRRDRRLL